MPTFSSRVSRNPAAARPQRTRYRVWMSLWSTSTPAAFCMRMVARLFTELTTDRPVVVISAPSRLRTIFRVIIT